MGLGVCLYLIGLQYYIRGTDPPEHIRKEGLSLSTARRCGGPVVPYHCQSSTFEFVIYYKLSCTGVCVPFLMRFRCTSIKHGFRLSQRTCF